MRACSHPRFEDGFRVRGLATRRDDRAIEQWPQHHCGNWPRASLDFLCAFDTWFDDSQMGKTAPTWLANHVAQGLGGLLSNIPPKWTN
jgi:hypothetical protein